MRAPFPWFGGKSRCAATIWEALGDVPNYVEPFFGSGAVLLDPPYDDGAIDYAVGGRISGDVREWAIEHGEDDRLRIVLAGYDGEHAMPEGWTAIAWKAHGGYGSQRARGLNGNSRRERLWLSPHCLRPAAPAPALVDPRQRDLFASLVEAAE